MSIRSDFDIWVIEDRLGEVESFYLGPLERMARDLAGSGSFPSVHVVMLGVNETQKSLIRSLRKSSSRRYPLTKPKFHPPIDDHEIDPDLFIEFLESEMGERDIALIDPTVCGIGWNPPSDSDNYLYYVFTRVRSLKSPGNEDRVLMVSNVYNAGIAAATGRKIDANLWRRMQEATIGKFLDDRGAYDEEFRTRLNPLIFGSDEWMNALNDDGKGRFASFIEKIRRSERSKTIFTSVGTCATWALLHLLSPERHCAADLIEATNGKYYYDPASTERSSQAASLLIHENELYKVLIRRFVLYGLRRSWNDFCPPQTENHYQRDLLDHYKLWVEVTAADYYWYADEYQAVKSILTKLRKPQLTFSSGRRIDIENVRCEFKGKGKYVRYADLQDERLGIRRDSSRSKFVRFIDGSLSFKYTGETSEGKARFCYEIEFNGDESSVPEDGAPDERWAEFWRSTSESDFLIRRRGHVDKLQTRLSNRCYFARLGDMLSFSAPMPEEVAWWDNTVDQIRRLIDRITPQLAFDPEWQSRSRTNRLSR